MAGVKRYASHYLFIPEVGFLKQHVVELEEGFALRIFPLTEEIESVEWMPGVIVLCAENEITDIMFSFANPSPPQGGEGERLLARAGARAYLLYPFDFISMRPVAETRHRLLR